MFSDAIILITGADPGDRETILQSLGDQCHVVAAQTMDDALGHVTDSVDLVICEINASQLNGLDLMRRWKARRPETPFLMMADAQEITSAVEAMKNGAADCIVKPIDADELRSAALQLVNSGAFESGSGPNSSGGHRGHSKSAITIPPDTSLEDLERAAVEQALVQHHGNRTHAARTLGISVRTLQRKLKAWGMPLMSLHNPAISHSFLMSNSETPHSFGAHAH
jgi:DNA-binding NtrC family response regulator